MTPAGAGGTNSEDGGAGVVSDEGQPNRPEEPEGGTLHAGAAGAVPPAVAAAAAAQRVTVQVTAVLQMAGRACRPVSRPGCLISMPRLCAPFQLEVLKRGLDEEIDRAVRRMDLSKRLREWQDKRDRVQADLAVRHSGMGFGLWPTCCVGERRFSAGRGCTGRAEG